MINSGQTDKYERTKLLRKEAINQLNSLKISSDLEHQLIESPHLAEQKQLKFTEPSPQQTPSLKQPPLSEFNKNLKTALNYNPEKTNKKI